VADPHSNQSSVPVELAPGVIVDIPVELTPLGMLMARFVLAWARWRRADGERATTEDALVFWGEVSLKLWEHDKIEPFGRRGEPDAPQVSMSSIPHSERGRFLLEGMRYGEFPHAATPLVFFDASIRAAVVADPAQLSLPLPETPPPAPEKQLESVAERVELTVEFCRQAGYSSKSRATEVFAAMRVVYSKQDWLRDLHPETLAHYWTRAKKQLPL
jgi:hypothetical protein